MKKIKTIVRKMNLRQKIIILTLAAMTATCFATGIYVYAVQYNSSVYESSKQISETMMQMSKHLNEKLQLVLNQYNRLQMNTDFMKVSKSTGETSRTQYINEFDAASRIFSEFRAYNSDIIYDFVYYRKDGMLFTEYTSLGRYSGFDQKEDIKKAEKAGDYYVKWCPRLDGFDEKIFGISQVISYDLATSEGVLTVCLDKNYIKGLLNELKIGNNSITFVCDGGGNIVSYSNDIDEIQTVAHIEKLRGFMGEDYFSHNDGTTLYTGCRLAVNDWFVISVAPIDELVKGNGVIWRMLAIVIAANILLYTLLSVLLIKTIINPIKKLDKSMLDFGNGDFRARYESDNEDEIAMLGESFNLMITNIQQLIEERDTQRQLKETAELRVLQEQINPHFLYNTLDSIYWMCQCGNNSDAADMTEFLSVFYRLGLNKGNARTTVKNEIEHVKNYMLIQQIRHKDVFDYEIDMQPGVEELKTVKILLQPLVENAITHGFYEADIKGGIIKISAKQDDGRLIFTVEDNGVGFDAEKVCQKFKSRQIEETAGKKGYGLINVYDRIKYKYGEDGVLSVESTKNKGTKVTIVIPVEY